jgi:hypothetical protein
MDVFDVGAFGVGAIGPIPYAHASTRVVAYSCEPGSGWATYDLPAEHARRSGQFDEVGPWSLLLANALSGRVDQSNVAAFDMGMRREFADRVAAVPATTPLAEMSDHEVEAVVALASFGFKGVWGPKTTKLAALYRPLAVPVLDGQMARAFGIPADAFRKGPQWTVNIGRVIRKLATWQREESNATLLSKLRSDLSTLSVQIDLISDVRLLDIILWTSQDDRFSRRRSKRRAWVDTIASYPVTLDDAASVTIPAFGIKN